MLRVKRQLPVLLLKDVDAAALDGEVDMQPVAAFVTQRLGQERRAQPVLVGNRANRCLEGHGVIRRLERTRVLEINLVLSRPVLVVAAFGDDAHVFQRQANIPADVLALIQRRHVHVAGAVLRVQGNIPRVVGLEEVELVLRADLERQPQRFRLFDLLAEDTPAIPGKERTVRQEAVAHHAGDAPRLRTPRQEGDGLRVRAQEQLAMADIAEALDRRRIERDAAAECPVELRGHDGDVFERAEQIDERQTDKFDVVFFDEVKDFLFSHRGNLLVSRRVRIGGWEIGLMILMDLILLVAQGFRSCGSDQRA